MVAYSGQTCFDEYAQTITVNASPQVRFDSLSPVCQEIAGFRLTSAADTSRLPGMGRYSGPGISADVFNPGLAGTGRHVIRFTQTSTAGCSAFRERTIEVYPTPGVDAGIDRIILEGDSVRLNAKATGRGLAYLWSPPTAIDDPTRLDPFVRPIEDTRYRLRVTSTDGCTATDEMQVLVLLKPIAPNTFTPNGDGVNDTWVIRHLEKYPGAILEVFSTTGQLLYREVGYSKPWDGTWQGRPQPAGTYYYVIDPRNGRPRMAGYVTIYR